MFCRIVCRLSIASGGFVVCRQRMNLASICDTVRPALTFGYLKRKPLGKSLDELEKFARKRKKCLELSVKRLSASGSVLSTLAICFAET